MYQCRKLVTYVGVNQVDFQSKTAKLTPNYLKPKSQQEKAVFCQNTCKIQATLQEEYFHWNLNFAVSLLATMLNLNSAFYFVFKNLPMIP